MGIVWLGVPPTDRTRRRMAFDGPVAVFEGAAFAFLCEQCEAFRQGLSDNLDEYGYRVIDGPVLEEFGWLVGLLRHAVAGYPEEWPVEGGLAARRDNVLQQLAVLAGVVERARAEGRAGAGIPEDARPARPLVEHFADLTDPRIDRTEKHRLDDIPVIALSAPVCGDTTFEDIEEFAESCQDGRVAPRPGGSRRISNPEGVPLHSPGSRSAPWVPERSARPAGGVLWGGDGKANSLDSASRTVRMIPIHNGPDAPRPRRRRKAMTARERLNFEMLRTGPCVSAEYVTDFYGLPWPLPHDAGRDFNTWTAQLPRRRTCSDGYGSRYELEAFLQHQGLLPKKWMAARFGMTEPALDEVLARLPDLGMRPSRYVVYPELIAKSLAEDIVPNLPGLKFRTFSDHDSFCQRLHADLAKSLGVTILPLFCAVSKQLREYPPRFARDFDCITCAPLSAAHQMWLDFRKPMNLGSDRCSKLLFAENREGEDDLFSCIAGTSEPSDLDQYRALLAGGQHA